MSDPEYPGDDMPRLTMREAFDAMRHFLDAFWERGSRSSEGVSFLLSAMDGSMTRDGGPIDIAQWSDWLAAVRKVKEETRAKDETFELEGLAKDLAAFRHDLCFHLTDDTPIPADLAEPLWRAHALVEGVLEQLSRRYNFVEDEGGWTIYAPEDAINPKK